MARKLKVADKINPEDSELLQNYIGDVLDLYSVGDVNRRQAITNLAQLVEEAVRSDSGQWRDFVQARINDNVSSDAKV